VFQHPAPALHFIAPYEIILPLFGIFCKIKYRYEKNCHIGTGCAGFSEIRRFFAGSIWKMKAVPEHTFHLDQKKLSSLKEESFLKFIYPAVFTICQFCFK